jgi:hypothetical protein
MWGRRARAVLPAAGVLALVGVVAVAATGSTRIGSGETRVSAVDRLLDVVISLLFVALLVGAALFVYALTRRQEMAEEYAKRRRGISSGLVLVFVLLLIAIVARRFTRLTAHSGEGTTGRTAPSAGFTQSGSPPPEHTYQPNFAWLPVLVVLLLAALGATALLLAERRRGSQAEERVTISEAVADVLAETLDDLLWETDPRRAVIAAYARLERVLAAHGLRRRAAETPEEYLTRALGLLDVGARSLRRLTDLFTLAKFSQHEVDEGMRQEAIAALSQVRDELRLAEERRESERRSALTAAGSSA